jgi:hypothetical protein
MLPLQHFLEYVPLPHKQALLDDLGLVLDGVASFLLVLIYLF